MTKEKKPTLEEYRDIGAEFRELHSRLSTLDVKVCGLCGKKYGLARATKAFNQVRSKLDDRVFRQYPNEETNTLCEVFY